MEKKCQRWKDLPTSYLFSTDALGALPRGCVDIWADDFPYSCSVSALSQPAEITAKSEAGQERQYLHLYLSSDVFQWLPKAAALFA